MQENLRIEIHENNILHSCLFTFAGIWAFCVLLVLFCTEPLWTIPVILLFVIPLCVVVYFYEKKPTVITADGRFLRWRHLYGMEKIALTEIKKAACNPHTVNSRYGSCTYLELTLYLRNGEQIDFNERIDTEQVIADQIQGRKSNMPLQILYDYILEYMEQKDTLQ